MDIGAFSSGLLTGLREGVEAALIVAIVLAYLAKTGNGHHARPVWAGVLAAVAASVVVGVALFVTIGGLPEPWEQVFEGVAMLVAAGVVTWMLFWMRRQARSVRGQLQAAVDRALDAGGVWGLAALAFVAVIREGIETSLFLVGQATSAEGGASSVLVGALVGLALAVGLGAVIYGGSRRIDLGSFFRWTGVALVFIAGGLLGHAVHEFVEVGLIPFGTQVAYDVSAILPDDAGIGQFLRALFGYSAHPELVTLAVHVTYVVVVLWLYLRPLGPAATPSRQEAAAA